MSDCAPALNFTNRNVVGQVAAFKYLNAISMR